MLLLLLLITLIIAVSKAQWVKLWRRRNRV
jgi:hypothetical protein